ncbi:MAG: chemotaxis response regulator protein-glutamate methylesterase [Pseudomonadota bacterium]
MNKTKVLIVDDSRTMRHLIGQILAQDEEIEVVGQAADPYEAREAMKSLEPDVITLDVEMPNMNGIDFLSKIMRLRPTPVIMVSNLTARGTEATIKALEIGAFDCIAKPAPGDSEMFPGLAAKIKAAAAARSQMVKPQPQEDAGTPAPASRGLLYEPDGRIVAIGASTGGVEALIAVVSKFPENCPPTVITQHMPATFTKSFADRLDRLCPPRVSEAIEGAPLLKGHVYLAPGSVTHLEISSGRHLTCHLSKAAPVNGHRPSVDVMFRSVTAAVKSKAVGVILTGMGRDGADGLLGLRKAGASTIGQNRATSLVYGMPRVAFEIEAVEKQLPLEKIGGEILRLTNKNEEGGRACRSRLP